MFPLPRRYTLGEQFISDRARHARTERCAAFEREINTRHLFSEKPHIVEMEYRCEPIGDAISIKEGDEVYLLDGGGDKLAVVQGNRRVATLGGSDATHCLSELRIHCPAGGALPAQVVQPPGLDGAFVVKLALSEEPT
jgi:hypothetical protein